MALPETTPVIHLKPGREQPVRRRHPWIFSGAVGRIEGRPKDGDRVSVADHRGEILGWGHFHDGSIQVKLVAFGALDPADLPLVQALNQAWELRRTLGLGPNTPTTGFRLVHGEGDHLPGLVVDVYGETAVFQAHSIGMYRERDLLTRALLDLPGLGIRHVFDKSSGTLPSEFAKSVDDGTLTGGSEANTFLENGIPFHAQWAGGQKTGFFLDQRENRDLFHRYAQGRTILNTFAYSGGFSIYALKSGADQVVSVDVSGKALALLQENLLISGVEASRHTSVQADVLPYLRDHRESWDMVVLDPPAFAKSLNKRHQAVLGYKRLNALGMAAVRPGGLLWTFSCSQVVDSQLFRDTITAAALEAGREAKILHVLSQGPDHPVNLSLPETSYLKGLVLEIR